MITSTKASFTLIENEVHALKEIKRRVQDLFPIHDVILFGSKARGDSGDDSDIDLLFITEQRLDWRDIDMIIGETYEANLIYGTLFTAHAIALSDWDNGLWTGLAFKENIEKDGIVV